MKIILYIILMLIGLIILFFGGALIYIKYFDQVDKADVELSPAGLFDDVIVKSLSETTQELRNGTQVSIAVITGDSSHFFGVKRESDLITPHIDQSAVFEIGSITKVLTAYVIHRLVEQELLDMGDSLVDHLPINNTNLNGVTIRTLINHTSGLSRMPDNIDLLFNDDPYRDYTKQDLYAYLETIDREVIKSEQEYSNLGYGVLGAIAEESSGKSMSKLYQELIFEPLGMDNSSFYLDSVNHTVQPGIGPIDSPGNHWNFDILGAAGAVKSSADQMASFMGYLLQQDELVQEMQSESYINSETSSTGLGLFISKKEDDPAYWHNGATGGFNSCMIYNPVQQLGIVILTNHSLGAQPDNKIDRLAFKIFRHLQTQLK